MKLTHLVNTTAALAALATVALAGTAGAHDGGRIRADTMIGLGSTLTGSAGNIRGINGAGLPWSIGDAEVSLKAGGKLEVSFEGLVFAAGPNVGKNTIPSMAVVVSCLDSANQTVNVRTDPFPVTVAVGANHGGDGSIETRLSLPSPCLAPIVLITNASGTGWFAADGL